MQCRGARRAAFGPTAAENTRDALEIVETVSLHDQKRHHRRDGNHQPDNDGRCRCGAGLQLEEQGQAKRGIGDLRDKFEGYVDDRAGCRGCSRHAGECQRPRAKHIPADLRQWQHLGPGIANQPPPDRHPGRYSGHQHPPGEPHHDHQREMDRADRRETKTADREQRADHRAGAEIADKRQHDADTENGGENRQSLHACALRMLCLGAVVIPRPVQRPAGFAGNGGSGEQETASPPGAGAGGRSRRGACRFP